MYPTLIGITGRKRHGKDTIADYLVANHGYIKLSLATPLKAICCFLFDLNKEQINGALKEIVDPRYNASPREIMQFVGTDLFRNKLQYFLPDIADNFWVFFTINKILKILKTRPNAKFVISDIRFPNEISALNDIFINNFKIDVFFIRVTRFNTYDDTLTCFHESETYINTLPVDFDVINDGSIEDLNDEVLSVLKNYCIVKLLLN